MTGNEIIHKLEKLSPREYACDWDNVGLMAGDASREVKKILVTLDVDDAAIDRAIACKADMIVSHHPFIFGKLNRVVANDLTGGRVLRVIENHISVYSMHTNFDVKGGMAELAADKIGLIDGTCLEEVYAGEGIGRVGDVKETWTAGAWATKVKEIFGLPHVTFFGDENAEIKRVAICPGSGKDEIPAAIQKDAQLLITGDIGHHAGIDAVAQKLNIIDAGHYGIEHIFIGFIAEYLKNHCENVEIVQMEKKIPYTIL